MADIQEIPLDDVAVEAPSDVAEAVEPAPKKRGRPAGAKNKAKPKEPTPPPAPPPALPPAKPKPKPKRKAPVHEEESSSEEEAPRQRRQRQAVEPMDTRALAADVLDLLQSQRMSRTMQRRNHYASFFQNM